MDAEATLVSQHPIDIYNQIVDVEFPFILVPEVNFQGLGLDHRIGMNKDARMEMLPFARI